jgi:hypothetical protein
VVPTSKTPPNTSSDSYVNFGHWIITPIVIVTNQCITFTGNLILVFAPAWNYKEKLIEKVTSLLVHYRKRRTFPPSLNESLTRVVTVKISPGTTFSYPVMPAEFQGRKGRETIVVMDRVPYNRLST